VSALHGADHLEALTIRDVKTGANRVVDTCALFIMVGAAPNTEWLSGLVKLDDKGFVITGSVKLLRPLPLPPRCPASSRLAMFAQARSSALPPQSAKDPS